ncbi:MAG: hypothetical protein ACO4CZ_16570, partial [Planctomycetota bacterium]
MERGLRVVRRELVLHASLGVGACAGAEGEGLVIDALGADAVGAPVLLFIAQLEQDRCLPARISEATEWFARNAAMLTPILDGDGVRLDLPARVFVVGFEFTASCMERLSALSQAAGAGRCTRADVSAFRVEGLVLDGVHHVGVARVLGGAGDGRLRAPAESELGKRCEQLAELLECLDPELTQDGEPVRVSPEGLFVIGFGYHAGSTSVLEATLPDDLRTFLAEVWASIQADDDEATRIESDDLLQAECGYGGLID